MAESNEGLTDESYMENMINPGENEFSDAYDESCSRSKDKKSKMKEDLKNGKRVGKKGIQRTKKARISPIKVDQGDHSKGPRPRKASQKLFIGNIAQGTTDQELKSVFEKFASVTEAVVIKNEGYGFVHIEVDANAGRQKVNQIIKNLNGYNFNG